MIVLGIWDVPVTCVRRGREGGLIYGRSGRLILWSHERYLWLRMNTLSECVVGSKAVAEYTKSRGLDVITLRLGVCVFSTQLQSCFLHPLLEAITIRDWLTIPRESATEHGGTGGEKQCREGENDDT